jgi:DNA-binding GntR family transcriptional regulator
MDTATETRQRRGDRGAAIRANLLTAILEQRLHPGTKLGEDEIGAIFGVSRTIVRSVLQALAHEGIVVIEKNRGAFVASPTLAEAQEVFEARRLIEPAIAARAAARSSAAWAERLAAHLQGERRALDGGDAKAAIRLSGEFHLLVADIAGHRIYRDMLGELIARSSLIVLLYRSRRAHYCGTDDHEAIARALAEGDGEEAGRRMVEHLAEIEHGLDLVEPGADEVSLADILLG